MHNINPFSLFLRFVLIALTLGGAGCDLLFLEPPPFLPPPCGQDERVQVENGSGLYLCVPCDPGSTNEVGDDRLNGTSQCDPTLCSLNERVNDHACEPCEKGTFSASGSDASGPDTQCEPLLCAFGERVSGNVCVMCPAGTFNKAGDNASGGDTTCDDNAMCRENQYVSEGVCEDCPPGTTRPAGDLLLAGNSECIPTRCERDEHVIDNACIGCPPGASNDPGDLASGENTRCSDTCIESLGVFCIDFEEAYIKSSNPNLNDLFGTTVVVDGNTIAIGAPGEGSSSVGIGGAQDNNFAEESGAVYVFVRDAAGAWTQQAYLKASNVDAGDTFGFSAALYEDRLIIGAPGEASQANGIGGNQSDNEAPLSGAVYLFELNSPDGTWVQRSYIKASNTDNGDRFGNSVALDENTMLVGAVLEGSSSAGVNGVQNNNSLRRSGAAYIRRLAP